MKQQITTLDKNYKKLLNQSTKAEITQIVKDVLEKEMKADVFI